MIGRGVRSFEWASGRRGKETKQGVQLEHSRHHARRAPGSLSPHASDAAAVSDREIYMEQPAETPFASRAREKQIENKLLVLRLELLSTLSSMDTGLGAKVNHEKTSVEFVGVEILASLPKVSLPELPGPFTAPYDSQSSTFDITYLDDFMLVTRDKGAGLQIYLRDKRLDPVSRLLEEDVI